ncbi:hypothetical protein [Dyadobacter sp. 3J3]|nr:hypothetical protein [Dyadobacter sp. 3J3]
MKLVMPTAFWIWVWDALFRRVETRGYEIGHAYGILDLGLGCTFPPG